MGGNFDSERLAFYMFQSYEKPSLYYKTDQIFIPLLRMESDIYLI